MKAVCDASPLISLARLGQLAVLPALFEDIAIATEVHHEVVVSGAGRPGAEAVRNATWLRVLGCPDPSKLGQWRSQHPLGSGELATIVLAQSLRAEWAVIDERAARRLAVQQGQRVIGTIGVLEAAHRRGLVPRLRDVYAQMPAEGVRVHPDILNRSLAALGLPPL